MTYLRSPRSNIWRRNWSKRNSRRDHMEILLGISGLSRYIAILRQERASRQARIQRGRRRIRPSSVPTVSPTSPTQAPPVAPVLAERVRTFLEACEIDRNLSPLTIRQYDHYLNHLLGWLGREQPEVKDLPDITSEVVRRYKLALTRHLNEHTGRPLTRATQTYFLIALRSMLRYWTLQGLQVLAPDRIELGKAPSRSLKFLDGDQLRRLLAAPHRHHPPGPRVRAPIETFFSTGLPPSALARPAPAHIKPKTPQV